jgi:hypothetical protein
VARDFHRFGTACCMVQQRKRPGDPLGWIWISPVLSTLVGEAPLSDPPGSPRSG